MVRHLLSLSGLDQDAFEHLVSRAAAIGDVGGPPQTSLAGGSVGLLFLKTSTRTRMSFAAAAARLGAQPLAIGPGDLQTNTGETLEDTLRVLSGYLLALVTRTAADPTELAVMASASSIPVINAMTADEHPTQALSDLAYLKRRFRRLDGRRIAYLGEGNSTAAALALAVARVDGLELELRTPANYGLATATLEATAKLCRRHGGRVVERHTPPDDLAPVDALYATRWQTTGTSKADPLWRERFAPYRATTALMERIARPDAIFCHDLPAVRGEDCDSTLLDGRRSVAFEQARQKLFTAMAILEWSCA